VSDNAIAEFQTYLRKDSQEIFSDKLGSQERNVFIINKKRGTMMKILPPALFLAIITILSSHSFAAVECISKASAQLTLKNNNCDKHCTNWDKDVAPQTITLMMPEQFKSMGAFFKNPTKECTGATCGWGAFPTPGVTSPDRIDYTFRHWSKPALVTISADICVYNASTPGPAPPPNPEVTAAPVLIPTAPTPLPPQKDHAAKEAGPMTPDDCVRMSNNWKTDGRNYCLPYNLNLSQISLTCKSDSDNLGRSVTGIVFCMK
jgi:hypothetical protein